MKAIFIMGAIISASVAANAGNTTVYQCTTDTGKNVEVAYSRGELDKVVIDGATYTDASSLILPRGGEALVFVANFRNNETLQMVIQASSYYKLGSGSERQMNCKKVSSRGSSVRNDGI